MKGIMNFTDKFKLAVYLFLASLAVILILLGSFTVSKDSTAYDIFINLATEIGGAALLFFIIEKLFSLGSQSKHIDASVINLIRSGIAESHPSLPREKIEWKARKVRREIRILGIWLYNQEPISKEMIEAAKSGKEVKLLLANPDSYAAQQRLKDLDGTQDENARYSCFNVIKNIIEKESLTHYQFQLRVYDCLPPFRLHQVDDWMVIGFFFHGKNTSSSPQIELIDNKSDLSIAVNETFDKIWENAKVYDFSQPLIVNE